MKILKLEWRNIFGYGNKIETLELGEEGKLWQLSGRSGSGKSSLLSIPKLLLYGKTEGSSGKLIKTSNIANWINQNGWIRGTIKNGNNEFIVERTFSPSSLTVYKNGENLDKAGLKDMQAVIDSEILDNLPYHIFSNVMILSLNNFKSFISMTPGDKRLIIDKIFSLDIINKVYELIKKDMKELGNSINLSNSQIYSLEQTIKTSSAELEALSKRTVDDHKDTLSELEEKGKKLKELYDKKLEEYQAVYANYTNYSSAESLASMQVVQECNKCNDIHKQIQLFSEDKCPTCGTPFNGKAFDDLREELDKEYREQYAVWETQNNLLQTATAKKNEAYNELTSIKADIDKILAKNNEVVIEIKSIQALSTKTEEYKSIQNIINETKISKVNLEKFVNESNSKMNLLNIMESLYSSEGIKKKIMENYLPTLNEEIKSTLTALSFPYSLEFDSNFNPHLEYLGSPVDVENLSAGEHKKVDLTVLCSILKMLKRKYPQVNLVCLDETLSSLDYESSTDIITYLQEIASTMNLNIFIVSHTQLDENLFDARIHIDKNSGFSNLTYV